MQNFYSIFSFGFFFADFSISEIATDFGLDLAGGLKEGAVNFILERLGLEEFFSGAKCDKRRKPFSPSVQGWNNGKMFIMSSHTPRDQRNCVGLYRMSELF
jgi:hypothetical protein